MERREQCAQKTVRNHVKNVHIYCFITPLGYPQGIAARIQCAHFIDNTSNNSPNEKFRLLPEKRDHLLRVFRRPVRKAHAHAAAPDGRDFQIAVSKFPAFAFVSPSKMQTVRLTSPTRRLAVLSQGEQLTRPSRVGRNRISFTSTSSGKRMAKAAPTLYYIHYMIILLHPLYMFLNERSKSRHFEATATEMFMPTTFLRALTTPLECL